MFSLNKTIPKKSNSEQMKTLIVTAALPLVMSSCTPMMIGYPQSVEGFLSEYSSLKARESRQTVSNPLREYRNLADAGYHIVFHNGGYLQGQKTNLPGQYDDFLNAYAYCLNRAGYADNPDVALQVRKRKVESASATPPAVSPQITRETGNKANSRGRGKKQVKNRGNANHQAPAESKPAEEQNWDDIPDLL